MSLNPRARRTIRAHVAAATLGVSSALVRDRARRMGLGQKRAVPGSVEEVLMLNAWEVEQIRNRTDGRRRTS